MSVRTRKTELTTWILETLMLHYISVLFSVSNNKLKEVMKCPFLKFAGDNQEGRNSQCNWEWRDPDLLKEWGEQENFQIQQMWSPMHGKQRLLQCCRLDGLVPGSSAGKFLEFAVVSKLSMNHQCVPATEMANCILSCRSKRESTFRKSRQLLIPIYIPLFRML